MTHTKPPEDPSSNRILDALEKTFAALVEQGHEPALVAILMESFGLGHGVQIEGAERWARYCFLSAMQLTKQVEVENADGSAVRH